ncbi:hypothetical protein TPY_2343 [Sulfobacillus acidophilus TPY]|nr:hypothetical protein TPY_2343 [Sulfobacillus acidophilus TPY]
MTGPELPSHADEVPDDPSNSEPGRVARHDGLIWIDQAGKVKITNPRGRHGRYAVLAVPESDTLGVSVNGRRVVGECVVEKTDQVTVRLSVQAPETLLDVHISPDGMEATLTVTYRPGVRRILQPTVPAPRLEIRPTEVPLGSPPATLAQVQTKLASTGITVGVIPSEAIQRFLDRRESGTLVIARGIHPRRMPHFSWKLKLAIPMALWFTREV